MVRRVQNLPSQSLHSEERRRSAPTMHQEGQDHQAPPDGWGSAAKNRHAFPAARSNPRGDGPRRETSPPGESAQSGHGASPAIGRAQSEDPGLEQLAGVAGGPSPRTPGQRGGAESPRRRGAGPLRSPEPGGREEGTRGHRGGAATESAVAMRVEVRRAQRFARLSSDCANGQQPSCVSRRQSPGAARGAWSRRASMRSATWS